MKFYSVKNRKVEIEDETSELEFIKCDCCGKKIEEKAKFYDVSTSERHDDCRGMNFYDICEECIINFTKEYLTNTEDEKKFIEIEPECYLMHDERYRNGYNEFEDGLVSDGIEKRFL